jgi:prolycopene isomerase
VTDYVDLCREVREAIAYLGASKGNPDRKVLTSQYANFLKTCPYTADQVARALKVPPAAQQILHAQWCYLGLPTSRLSFTIYAAMLYLYLQYNAWIPRFRSHEFTTALETRIRALGGEVVYHTRAERILVRDGRVTGVETSQGDHISTKFVVSNASPTLVYNQLVQPRAEVPARARQTCNARIDGLAGFVVYLGLDAPPEELGIEAYSYFLYDSMDTEALYDSLQTLDAPKMQAAMCLNRAIPDASPPGTTLLSLTTLFRPEAWAGVTPPDYIGVKNRIAAALIADFEQATGAPIRAHIEEFEVATPQTFARYTGVHGGIIYGYEPEPWDSLIPRMMSMQDETYIEGLEFCGGFAFRCHGYSSTLLSGQTAALLTWRELVAKGEIR